MHQISTKIFSLVEQLLKKSLHVKQVLTSIQHPMSGLVWIDNKFRRNNVVETIELV